MNFDSTMGHIHVCSANVVPCEDPEDQMVVSITVRLDLFQKILDIVKTSILPKDTTQKTVFDVPNRIITEFCG